MLKVPWLPLAPDHADVNVARQKDDERSMLTLTRRLIEMRRSHKALLKGTYRSLDAPDGLLAYLREYQEQRLLVVLNFTSMRKTLTPAFP